MKQSKRLQDIHQEAKLQFNRAQSALHDEREQCYEDRRFYSIAGAPWEGKLGEQFADKPKIEVNKAHLAVIRIINEYRNNRIDVDFISKVGVENDQLADTCDGLYRADEQESSAQEAHDNAFEEAVGGGFGAFRLCSQYEDEYDEENERQRIRIEPIYDADTSVFFDLDAKKYDKSDAKHCFVLIAYTRESFMEMWDDDPSSWPQDIDVDEFDWNTPDKIYVAEYYRVEEKLETIYTYKTLDGEEVKYRDDDFKSDTELEDTLNATGVKLENERKIKVRRVHKYIMSGNSILEDNGYLAGKNIPIIPVYGKRWYVGNIERCMGHVRLVKDVSRLYNMQMSKLVEISALSTVEKPIVMPEQIAGHQKMWEEDNIKDYPYLMLNPITGTDGSTVPAGPLAYTRVPNIPPALAALMQITNTDIKELLGNQENGEKITSNISGKAVELIQDKLDMQAYIYVSNMAKSIKRSGEVWLSMAQDLFVEEGRKMKSLGSQGEMNSIELMRPVIDPKTGAQKNENDISKASFDVVATVGPSSNSKRSSTVRALTDMLKLAQSPEDIQVLTGMAIMNMEGEGIQDVKNYYRDKMIKIGVVKPTDHEAQELQQASENQPEDPNSEFLRSSAEEAQANAAKARADTILTIAKAEETRADTDKKKAETMETLAGIEETERKQAIESGKSLNNFISGIPDLTSD